jgi:hypothetical protein
MKFWGSAGAEFSHPQNPEIDWHESQRQGQEGEDDTRQASTTWTVGLTSSQAAGALKTPFF